MKIRSIINGSIGNTLEWYDFGLFEVFAPTISQLFFPASDPHTMLIMTFGIFAAGYICRPLGGLIFGYFGDKKGRSVALRYSVIFIALPTFMIGLLPTYAQVGIAAPIILMLVRIWQGICVGGECGGNVVYLAEMSAHHQRGLITSFSGFGANLGYLLSLVVSVVCNYIFTHGIFIHWGWRVPYLLSGILCLIIFITRMNLRETEAFHYLSQQKNIVSNPVSSVMQHNKADFFRVTGLFTMGIAFFYACFVYMPTLLTQKLHYPALQINQLMIIMTVIMMLVAPLAGMLCDKIGRKKLFLLVSASILIAALPCFYFLSIPTTMFSISIILFIFTMIVSLEQGVSYVAAAENFPLHVRYTGVSMSYNVGAALFGGTTPLICEWLIGKTQSLIAPAFYVMMCAILTSIIVWFFMHDKHGESLAG